MEKNQHQELSFSELAEMTNFEFNDNQTTTEEPVITLENEEEQKEELETPKEEEVEKEEETNITIEPSNNIYLSLLKDRLDSCDLEDAILEIDGKEVKISELEDLDEETYKAILEDDKKYKKEQFDKKYVSVEDLTDTQKTLIDIIKSGDYDKAKELFENPQQLTEPFQGFDSDDEGHQEQVLRWYYTQQGNSPKEVEALLKVAKEDFTLDSKANQIVDFQRKQFKANLENQAKQLEEAKKQEQEKIKNYRKELAKEFKTVGVLEEGVIKKYTELATKTDKDGNLEIDNIYERLIQDPKEAVELIHFMLDKENYLKNATKATKLETQKDLLRKVNVLRDTSKTSNSKTEKEEPKNEFENLIFPKQ